MNRGSDGVETIFGEAIAIADAADRQAFLDRACSDDSVLRGQLEALIKSHFRSGKFLETPAIALGKTVVFPGIETPGAQIGPYKLLQVIGEGGMGVVYMAEQREPVERRVALKIIKPGMDSQNVIARFEAERQALALMDHPNIAHVFDAGTTVSGKPYFVMELVKGVPITAYCDENHLSPVDRLGLFISVCQAVQHAHQKGVIHRDIKPSNVLVALYDGTPTSKVIDFGIAKATTARLTDRTLFTEFGQVVGTLEYMSPEQALFNQLDIDTRTDIYSLGVLLYELLTGTTPLERKRLKATAFDEMLRIIREVEPPRPSTRLSATDELPAIAANRGLEPKRLSGLVRGDLDWIVMRALEKDRSRRYETANGLATDIRCYLANEPVLACPPTARYRFAKFARRNRLALITASLVATALVSGIIVSTWQAIRATQAQTLAQSAEDNERAANLKAQSKLWQSYLEQAKAGRRSNQPGQRMTTLETIQQAVALGRELDLPPDRFLALRNEAIAALALWDMRLAREWTVPGAEIDYFSFDEELSRYAYLDRELNVGVRRMDDHSEICQLPRAKLRCWAVISPKGGHLFTYAEPNLQLFSIVKENSELLLEDQTVASVVYHPDGQHIATGHLDGSITIRELDHVDKVTRIETGVSGRCKHLAFHPTDKNLLASTTGGQIYVWDLTTHEVRHSWRHDGDSTVLAWRPQGDLLAFNAPDVAISICEIGSQKPPNRLLGHGNLGVTFAFNHAGTMLASTCWDSTVMLWSPHSSHARFSMPGRVIIPQFSKDDSQFAGVTDRNRLQLWDVRGGDEFQVFGRDRLKSAEQLYGGVDVSPDGRLLLVGTSGGACLWDLASGREIAEFGGGAKAAGFMADGSIWTNQPGALQHWPRSVDPDDAAGVIFGPPEKIPLNGSYYEFGHSHDGRVFATATGWGADVLVNGEEKRHFQLRHTEARNVGVDPEGRFIATSDHDSTSLVKIWDAQTGELVRELAAGVMARPIFSPDGRLLVTGGGTLCVWEVDSWKEITGFERISANATAFSPDSRILVFESGKGELVLIDPLTRREFARLASPYQKRAGQLTFTPDAGYLQMIGEDRSFVYRWNLRSIRRQLAPMGLDWDLPLIPSPAAPTGPLKVRVDAGP